MTEGRECNSRPSYWLSLTVFQNSRSKPGQAPVGWPHAISGQLPALRQILPWRACSSQMRWELRRPSVQLCGRTCTCRGDYQSCFHREVPKLWLWAFFASFHFWTYTFKCRKRIFTRPRGSYYLYKMTHGVRWIAPAVTRNFSHNGLSWRAE